jgi:hypothetical protein
MPGNPDDNSINPSPAPQDDPRAVPDWGREDDLLTAPPRAVRRRPVVKGGGPTAKRVSNSGIAPRAKKTTTKKSHRKIKVSLIKKF